MNYLFMISVFLKGSYKCALRERNICHEAGQGMEWRRAIGEDGENNLFLSFSPMRKAFLC